MPYNMRKFNDYSCIFLLFFSLNTRLSKKKILKLKRGSTSCQMKKFRNIIEYCSRSSAGTLHSCNMALEW